MLTMDDEEPVRPLCLTLPLGGAGLYAHLTQGVMGRIA
jgi:hypothetical protein